MRVSNRVLGLALVVAAAACASGGSGGTGGGSGSGGGRRDVLVHAELTGGTSPATNLYDAIRVMRPDWLNTRAGSSMMQAGTLFVYLDNARLGTPDQLRSIRTDQVESVRYVNPTEAQARFGADHVHGAILVTSRR
jgi:hypothetical protein